MIEEKTNTNSDKGKVFIKKEAFRNMITHVLRFGSNLLEKSVEVMGVCLGKYDATEDILIIENAKPIIHGEKVEIGFDKDIYELFPKIKKEFALDLIGYYHSHPSWGLYLSESDLGNLQYFQNEKFPLGFCIVFDHTLMGYGEAFGFEIFRLDDYTKTDKYSSISYEIEIPSTLEYFKWVKKFMEDFQKESPILIKETDKFEEEAPRDLQEIPTTSISEEFEEQIEKYPEINSIISGFKQGSEKFSNEFMNTFQNQIKDWIIDIEEGNSRGSEYVSKAVEKMREAVVSGLLKLSGWFKKTMNESVNKFKNTVYNYIDTRIDAHKQVTEEISEIKQNLVDNLKSLIDNKIKNIDNEIEDLTNTTTQKLEDVMNYNLNMETVLTNLEDQLTSINKQAEILTQEIEKKIEESLTPLRSNLDEKIEKLSTELDPFKNNYSEIRILLDKLQKIITEFRNLT